MPKGVRTVAPPLQPNKAQLEVLMQAGIAAAERPGGSTDRSNIRRRIQSAINAKAKEIGVAVPNLTPRVMKHLQQVAVGYRSLLPDAEVSDEKMARAALLQQESDFHTPPEPLPEAVKRKVKRAEAELKPPINVGAAAKASRPPRTTRNTSKPPQTPKGHPKLQPGINGQIEAERRVDEIVKRLGLGATPKQIKEWARENWSTGTSDRNVDDYIAAARTVMRSNWQRDREDFMVDLLEQYQRLALDARMADQLGTALGCLNSMAKLCSIGGFASTTPNS